MNCQCCKSKEASMAWQPFGPEEATDSFALLGNHYRGFPVIKVCDSCQSKIQQSQEVRFSYRGNSYTFSNGIVANNNTSRFGDGLPVRKADLVGHSFERDAAIVSIDTDGSLRLVHVQAWLDDGRCIIFNGEIPIPLKNFEWTER